MSETSNLRAQDFLKISDQFRLGSLTTESSHPVTAELSQTAQHDVTAALKLLFQVEEDVIGKYREFVASGRALEIQQLSVKALRSGGKLFFTGCGSTGRLSILLVSIWRDFWQQERRNARCDSGSGEEMEGRAVSMMAGGDFALIKSVEGFEDYTAFGATQLAEQSVCSKDVVFAITEGGETSFVIGTAWQGIEAGAKVYFVYNNPDSFLCEHVARSRQVIEDTRIEKVNLTTGPMAITGSTRMQATTIQLCVLLTVLEMVVRELKADRTQGGKDVFPIRNVPEEFLTALVRAHATLQSAECLAMLARMVLLEESVYRAGRKTSYFADRFGIDVLTDTTERSPTYCTPPFRKFDDAKATESWAYLFVPHSDTLQAWAEILKRPPSCINWSPELVRKMVGDQKAPRTLETVRKIGITELLRFKIGLDGIAFRVLGAGDCAIAVISTNERTILGDSAGFYSSQLDTAKKSEAHTGFLGFGRPDLLASVSESVRRWNPECVAAVIPTPSTGFLLDGVTRVTVKMALNALSTCTMVRLGRVMGNFMIWVVPSNLKLIDRATRYIQKLTGSDYRQANYMLFEVIEYIEPRMKADQVYPPAVAVSVNRIRRGLSNEQAEAQLLA